jgi:proteasome alpha subunit
MSMPFYVSPEQLMKDRADFARKGIARGRSVAVVQYDGGVLFVSENPSQALHKISEIYDRVAFAAVGRYNEFENLRIAGVRLADMRGYAYDRRDVTGRGLANAYAQTLGTIFSSGGEKPYEVEIFVAEIGDDPAEDQVFRLTYDGQLADEHGFAAMGGAAESVTSYLKEHFTEGLALEDAVKLAVGALGHGEAGDRSIPPHDLEVAVLDRSRARQRKFRRLSDQALVDIIGPDPDPADEGSGEPEVQPPVPDDPADPTDMSSDVPPLENPVTGEPTPSPTDPLAPEGHQPSIEPVDPSIEPPVAPPADPDDPVA